VVPIGDHPIVRRDRLRQAVPRECCTPGCAAPPVEGRRFCTEHQQQLDSIREEWDADRKLRGRSAMGHAKDGRRRQRYGSAPMCCTLGCFNERVPPDAFCPTCIAAGAVEDS
jgi:hypothetical protein